MSYKQLIIFSITPWVNFLILYAFYFFKIESTLIGIYYELTMIPSLLFGGIFPLLLAIKFFRSFLIKWFYIE
jgi:hypothetical protein